MCRCNEKEAIAYQSLNSLLLKKRSDLNSFRSLNKVTTDGLTQTIRLRMLRFMYQATKVGDGDPFHELVAKSME